MHRKGKLFPWFIWSSWIRITSFLPLRSQILIWVSFEADMINLPLLEMPMLIISCLCDWNTKKKSKFTLTCSWILLSPQPTAKVPNQRTRSLIPAKNMRINVVYLGEIKHSLNVAHRTVSLFTDFHDSYRIVREQTDQEGSEINGNSVNCILTCFVGLITKGCIRRKKICTNSINCLKILPSK